MFWYIYISDITRIHQDNAELFMDSQYIKVFEDDRGTKNKVNYKNRIKDKLGFVEEMDGSKMFLIENL